MNRNAHLKISEGIDKAANPCHNEKKKDMIPCRGIIPTSKDLELRPTMPLVIHELEKKGVNHLSWGKGPFPPPKNSRRPSLEPISLWPPITN
jgi:hypothetical protein